MIWIATKDSPTSSTRISSRTCILWVFGACVVCVEIHTTSPDNPWLKRPQLWDFLQQTMGLSIFLILVPLVVINTACWDSILWFRRLRCHLHNYITIGRTIFMLWVPIWIHLNINIELFRFKYSNLKSHFRIAFFFLLLPCCCHLPFVPVFFNARWKIFPHYKNNISLCILLCIYLFSQWPIFLQLPYIHPPSRHTYHV